MDEATALLDTLTHAAPTASTRCPRWTAHELVAHLAAGAKEMADLAEAHPGGNPPRATRPFADREGPFVAMDNAVLRDVLMVEALRLAAAIDALASADGTLVFSQSVLGAPQLRLHGRVEAAMHRWDLVGDDDVGDELLGQPDLTSHSLTVLSAMLGGGEDGPDTRARRCGTGPLAAVVRSPGEPDVVVRRTHASVSFELAPSGVLEPWIETDPATRLLLLWGRCSPDRPMRWLVTGERRRRLERLLLPPVMPRPRRRRGRGARRPRRPVPRP